MQGHCGGNRGLQAPHRTKPPRSPSQVLRITLPSGRTSLRVNIDATRRGNVARFINHRWAVQDSELQRKRSSTTQPAALPPPTPRCRRPGRPSSCGVCLPSPGLLLQLRWRQHGCRGGQQARAPGAGGGAVCQPDRAGGRGAGLQIRGGAAGSGQPAALRVRRLLLHGLHAWRLVNVGAATRQPCDPRPTL